MFELMCKLLWEVALWEGLPLHNYAHGRPVSVSDSSLGLQLPSLSVYHMATGSYSFPKQKTLLLWV